MAPNCVTLDAGDVDAASELPDDLFGTVGVTAGASAPEELVEAVIAKLAPQNGTTEVAITDEDEYFPPPRELRDLLGAMEAAAHATLAVAPAARVSAADRTTAASDVLAATSLNEFVEWATAEWGEPTEAEAARAEELWSTY